MLMLMMAAAFFVAIHLVISGTRLRDALILKMGQGPYMGLFVVLSFVGLGWLGWAFAVARTAPGNDVIWGMAPWAHYLQIAIQLVAIGFMVIGLTTPNPTSVRQEGALDRPEVVHGILRVTRHPFLWGVAIWAAGHLLVNGEAASLVLFGSLLALALFGTASIDAKRKRALGAKWDRFAIQTSNVPFLAVIQGRQRLALAEIGWWRPVLAVVIWAVLAWAHPWLFGVAVLY